MAIVSESSLTIVVRVWIFMVVFCFAGCVAGSCLSYGHSCWGAHGKRSGGHTNNNAHLVPTRTNDVQQDVPSYAKEQWILSRLIAGRPLVPNKYREKWNGLPKARNLLPQRWNAEEQNIRSIDVDPPRDQNNNNNNNNSNNNDDDEVNARKIDDMREMARSINEESEDGPEILLISRNEYNEQASKPRNLDLIKLLSTANINHE